MSTARFIVGDAIEVLASLEPGSVDLVMSSPPFLALRSYLPADHPDKAREIGSEATPGEFIDTMLDVVEACARVLAPHGSLVIELGDTYADSGGPGGDYNVGGMREGQPKWVRPQKRFEGNKAIEANANAGDGRPRPVGPGWPMAKSKTLIPQLFAVALAYGFNPLTGRETEPWRVRNTVIWAKPNPPVGRDGDKFRPGHSTLTVACKARDRYWDGDAVRVPHQAFTFQKSMGTADDGTRNDGGDTERYTSHNPAGAPLLDWWSIPTQPYKGAHYATFPSALVVPVIEAMAPRRVCVVCGKPSTRVTGEARYVRRDGVVLTEPEKWDSGIVDGLGAHTNKPGGTSKWRENETLGWSDCDCPGDPYQSNKWRPGVVLDPFAGSGTTLAVATGHGRDCIGIDLDARNADLALERVGMFLTVEHFVKENVA